MAKIESFQRGVQSLFTKVRHSYSAASQVALKIRRVVMLGAYWSAVFVVGIGVAVLILQVNDVPVFQAAYAGTQAWVGNLIGTLLYYTIIGPIGLASVIVAYIMQMVINYPYGDLWASSGGGFVNVSAVQTGWKLIRDVCNMFFSLILVIIALATVLKIEAYSWKQMLPKLVLMAVLINFSKTICGIFTDFGTVAMATFGGSFGGTFAGGVIGAFGLPGLRGLAGTEGTIADDNMTNIVLAYIAAAIMTMIFFVIMLSFTVTLLFRIVMLWFLIVLSPIAYIARILPQTKKYSSQWWEMFGRYVVVGPLVTFFLWLSLTMAFGTNVGASAEGGVTSSGNVIGAGFSSVESTSASALAGAGYVAPTGAFAATTPNVLANFLVATMLLMASLKLIHQMAAEAGKLTGIVEGAAWGTGAALMATPGIIMQKFGSGVGSEQAVGADGKMGAAGFPNRALYWASHDAKGNPSRLAAAATFLGSTVFQPQDWIKGVAKGRKESYEAKKHEAKEKAEKALHDMRAAAIAGHGKDKNGNEINHYLAPLANLAGIIGGAGLDPKHVTDQYLSGGGLLRVAGKWFRRDYADNAKKIEEGELKAVTQALKEAKDGLTKEEATQALKDFQERKNAEALATNAAKQITGDGVAVNDTYKLDLQFEEVQAALNQQLANLLAAASRATRSGDTDGAKKLFASAKDLKKAIADKTDLTMADLQTKFAGISTPKEIQQLVGNAYKNRAGSLHKESSNLERRLKASGWDEATGTFSKLVPPQFTKDAQGNNQLNEKSREALAAKLKELDLRIKNLRSQALVYQEGDSYEARKHSQHLISEEARKISDIDNTQELQQYLERAIREKNHSMAEAVLRQITKKGDLNEMTQQYLADNDIQPIVETDAHGHKVELSASSDGEGLELYRREILMKRLGMSEHDSLRLANDLSFAAEGIGQMGYARSYSMENGHLHFLPRPIRAKAAGGELRKADVGEYTRWNRLAWGREDENRQFQLTELGLSLLVANGNSLAQDRLWERFNANSKLNLSQPRIVADLRKAGVDAEFIGRLEDYWQQTGQYETGDESQQRQRGALSRFATEDPNKAHH